MNGKMTFDKNIRIRPACPSDSDNLNTLFHQTRNFIYEYVDAEYEYKRAIVEQQEEFRMRGYGNQFPNALDFVIERLGSFVGRAIIDFGNDFIHLVDISFLKEAQGLGLGESVIKGIQMAASSTGAPLTLNVALDNLPANALYTKLGFVVRSRGDVFQRMVWHPVKSKIQVMAVS